MPVGTTPEEIAQAYGIPQTPQDQQRYYQSILDTLRTQAQPRSDIIAPGMLGDLRQERPYTFAGRVGYASQPESAQQMMQRVPLSELETGGRAMTSPQSLQQMMGLMGGLKGLVGLGTASQMLPTLPKAAAQAEGQLPRLVTAVPVGSGQVSLEFAGKGIQPSQIKEMFPDHSLEVVERRGPIPGRQAFTLTFFKGSTIVDPPTDIYERFGLEGPMIRGQEASPTKRIE